MTRILRYSYGNYKNFPYDLSLTALENTSNVTIYDSKNRLAGLPEIYKATVSGVEIQNGHTLASALVGPIYYLSSFYSFLGNTHQATQWQFSYDSAFNTITEEKNYFSANTSYDINSQWTADPLISGNTLYARARYIDSVGNVSEFSQSFYINIP